MAGSPIPLTLPTVFGDRVLYVMRLFGDMQIHCVVSLDGRVDAERLGRAVRLAMDAEPVLGCRFDMARYKPRWVRRDDLDDLDLCTVEKTRDPDAALATYLAAHGDPCVDPIVQAKVVRGPTDTVCLKVNHAAADAGGTKETAYLVCAIYNLLENDPGYRPVPNLAGRRALDQVVERLGFAGRLKMIRRTLKDRRLRFVPDIHWKYPAGNMRTAPEADGKYFVWRHIGPGHFRKLKTHAAGRSATVNDALVSAFCRAVWEEVRPGAHIPLRLRCTADLRRYLGWKSPEAICNLSGFVYLNLGPAADPSYEEILGKVRDQMRDVKGDMIGLGDWVMMPILLPPLPFAWTLKVARKVFVERTPDEMLTPTITNMGRFEPSRLAFGTAQPTNVFLTASVIYPPWFGIGVTGCGDSLTLSAGFCEAAVPRTRAEGFLDRVCELLPGSDGKP